MFQEEEIVLAVLNTPDIGGGGIVERYLKKYKVCGIITNATEEFKENYSPVKVPLYDYEIINEIHRKIIVADDGWQEDIRYSFDKILKASGLRLGEDYIYESMQNGNINTNIIYELMNRDITSFKKIFDKIAEGRKIVIIHGNCQSHTISAMLSGNKAFVKEYITVVMPRIWESDQRLHMETMIASGIFNEIDYMFTQEVSQDNKFWYKFSTDFVKSLLPEHCTIITISNLFFMGYFPQYQKMKYSCGINFFRGKLLDATEYMDVNVIKMILDNKSDEEILQVIADPDYYKKEELLAAINAELEEFKKRDKDLDIKMYDFLFDNYEKFLMFATSNHPTREVMKELTRRILKKLNLNDFEIECPEDEIQEPMPSDWRYIVYPSVLKSLDINRELTYYFKAILTRNELVLIPEGTENIEKTNWGNEEQYLVKVTGGFRTYMSIYIRCIRAALMLL